ncbi:MAG: hypothetical protein ACRD4O_17110, partial [Bryobacteraceae bacterium]
MYYLGLDVGKVRDPAAVCVLERRSVFVPGPFEPSDENGATTVSYLVRHLERLPLGTPYTAVCERVAEIADKLEASGCALADTIVDITGVGRPIFDLLLGSVASVIGVNFTAGKKPSTADGRIWNVPKRDLVAGLVLLFQSRELRIAEKLPDAQTLVQELVNFRQTISESGKDSYGNS